MSRNVHRRNVCEGTAEECEDDEYELARIIALSPDPEVDRLAAVVLARARARRAQHARAGRIIRQLRILARSDDLWLPPDDGGAAQAIPKEREAA